MIKPLLRTELLGFELLKSTFDGVPNFWKLGFNGFDFDMFYNNQQFLRVSLMFWIIQEPITEVL